MTLRVRGDVPKLRRTKVYRAIARCVARAHRATFRVCELAVMQNHLHLIVEASHRTALARGMQGLKIRLAKRLNTLFGRTGTFWAERYHQRILATPREVRLALQYVLNNARRHAAQSGRKLARGWIDPYSSAPDFRGWSRAVRAMGTPASPVPPTMEASTWLLARGWRRGGLLDPNVVPGGT